ncbi:MAG: ABC transporter substrate-binding protein [Ignavibacteria bacterium]|nr:ABC transporter substrate-binding protein [Ignavibacteria bacterium]
MKNRAILLALVLIVTSALFVSCGKSTKPKKQIDTKPVSIKQFDTPPGADPSVPPEQGGEGFTGEGWQTAVNYNVAGDSNAIKGGSFTMRIPDFPNTLRIVGKDANSYVNNLMEIGLIYEGLLSQDPVTEEWIPALATHWKVSDDKKTFWYRINPNARWADGKPVTAEDVVATWKLQVDPGILEAYSNILYGTYEQPVAESKYIVSVKTKEENWRQFLYFSGAMRILPAHYVGNLKGSEYLEKYQFDMIPGSGPYVLLKEDINKGQSVTFRRRSDYWAEKERFNIGTNNFDAIKLDVIQDESLAFEKFKKGDIDVYSVNRAQWWAERFDFDEFKRGLVARYRVFNENPNGVQGLVFNMRKPPFDDIRIRKAVTYLWDRNKFNEKLFFNSYMPEYSYYPGTVYENPNNPKIGFSLDSARILLEEAGWKDKNSEGYLVKDGKVFELDLPFDGGPGQERYLTIFQEDLKKAGIKLNLKQIDGTTRFKLGNERNFTILVTAWTGLRTPNPESSLKSNTADAPNTTNWPGIKDARIDELCDLYNKTYDKKERIKIVREIDGIASNYFGYGFGWYAPYQRIAFHNKFSYPEWILPRTNDYLFTCILWYYDPEKAAEYDAVKADPNKKMEIMPEDQKYWIKVKEQEEASGK